MKHAKLPDLDIARLKKKVRALDKLESDTHTLKLELANALVIARGRWPHSGPAAKGWGDFLDSIGLAQQRAWELMQLVAPTPKVSPDPVKPAENKSADHANAAPAGPGNWQLDHNQPTEQPEEEGPDRDSACTPRELAELLGAWDLDPCSNERSHIQAKRALRLDRGEDGLVIAKTIEEATRVFINPPYSNVMPWVEAYTHTRFCFLLKFDPSTRWCEKLLEHTDAVLFPKRTRIEFEAPPGAKFSSVQFPHGLFFARVDDAPKALREACFQFHAA